MRKRKKAKRICAENKSIYFPYKIRKLKKFQKRGRVKNWEALFCSFTGNNKSEREGKERRKRGKNEKKKKGSEGEKSE